MRENGLITGGLMNQGANASTEKPLSQVEQQLGQLNATTDYIVTRMEILWNRLQKVSRGQPPQAVEANKPQGMEPLCPVADDLRGQMIKLSRIASGLDSMLDLLEI